MKHFSDIITENTGDGIDEQWLTDNKPLQTRDGRRAVVLDIDRSEVPNILHGQVQQGSDMYDYDWDDTGKCLKAVDKLGNPRQADEKDNLVKGA